MVVDFSDREKMYLKMDKGRWSIKEGCPIEVKASLENKLSLLNNESKNNFKKS